MSCMFVAGYDRPAQGHCDQGSQNNLIAGMKTIQSTPRVKLKDYTSRDDWVRGVGIGIVLGFSLPFLTEIRRDELFIQR